MPPKKTFNRDDSDDDDDSTTETSSSEGEVAPTRQSNAANANNNNSSSNNNGRGVANKPHDEEFDAGHDDGVRTPPGETLQRRPSGATTQATVTPAGKAGGTLLRNNPNDETFDVEDDDERVRTPPQRGNNAPPPAAGGQRGAAAKPSGKAGNIQNNPHDYYEDAGDEGMETPPRQNIQPVAGKKPSNLNTNALGNRQLQNDTHDEAIDVSDNSQGTPASTYGSATPQSGTKHSLSGGGNNNLSGNGAGGNRQTLPAPQGKMSMAVPRDDESSSEEEDDDAGGAGQNQGGGSNGGNGLPTSLPGFGGAKTAANKPPPTQEYNPADYASINQRASREMQELFMTIAQYQPQVQELPSKLRPFIPDFIPSVGDLDPFCKVPRPDARPDNLGLTVVDEPSANQSNPAVVALLMKHVTRGSAPFVYVESVEDSSNRPNVIDKWIADIKDLHYKKPLPTVNYSKVMPEIESLLQAWSPEFEELLNSDLQFPPTQVDLDIDQYVRVMCAVLDIPTYGTLVESLHVMFTLYCEFRANQHFQHA